MSAKKISEIMKGLTNREFQVYYQPQYDPTTNTLRAAEALVRWIKPDGTIILPNDFIPLLEETDAILSLDWYVTQHVCEFFQKLSESGMKLIPISVNFSRKHVHEPDFVEKLCAITDQYNVPRTLLVVEITESALVEQPEKVNTLIMDTRNAGFRIAIDDFGSGLSSLGFIKNISADILKIDKSMLSENCQNEEERIVLESIFMFAHRLKWTTIAEGVETPEQLGFLKTCGCKLIQGFSFAKPMPEHDFIEICKQDISAETSDGDILMEQPESVAQDLLLEAVFSCYPLIIFCNLTKNSYYMMAYENYTAKSCPSSGTYDHLITQATATMYPDDREMFANTFATQNQIAAYERGEKNLRLITRQLGDDGIYRRVETCNYFVKNASSNDLLAITLSRNIEELRDLNPASQTI